MQEQSLARDERYGTREALELLAVRGKSYTRIWGWQDRARALPRSCTTTTAAAAAATATTTTTSTIMMEFTNDEGDDDDDDDDKGKLTMVMMMSKYTLAQGHSERRANQRVPAR